MTESGVSGALKVSGVSGWIVVVRRQRNRRRYTTMETSNIVDFAGVVRQT
jgi:hypothetical protein